MEHSGEYISAVALDDNRVFVAHSDKYNSTYNQRLYGIVVTIGENNIEIGTDVLLSERKCSGYRFSAVKLEDNKVFILHGGSYNATYNGAELHATICTINENVISVNGDTQLINESRIADCFSIIALSNNKVFIAHSKGNAYSLYGMICTIDNENTVSVENDIAISEISYAGMRVAAVALEDNRIFIAHSRTSNYNLFATVVKIEENNVLTEVQDVMLDINTNVGKSIEVALISNDKVFVAHKFGENQLGGVVCQISDSTISHGICTALSSNARLNDSGPNNNLSVALTGNKIFIAYCNGLHYLNGLTVSVNNKEITVEEDKRLDQNSNSGVGIDSVLLNDKIVIFHSFDSNYTLSVLSNNFSTTVGKVKSKNDVILGVAKTSGTEGDNIKVYVPKIEN